MIGGAVGGVRLLGEAGALLRSERSLWGLALVPVVFTAAAFVGVAILVTTHSETLWDFTSAWLPWPEPAVWWHWAWVGPARALSWFVARLLFASAALVALILGLFAANALAAPFLDLLSERVEERVDPDGLAVAAEGRGGIAIEALRSIGREVQRLVFFLACWFAIWVPLLFVPGGPAIAPFLVGVLTVFFLPLDFASYSLDRRSVGFAERRRWLRREWPTMLGFGGGAFAIGLVPGLNLLLLPVLVVGGTLLVLRRPPASVAGVVSR